MYLHHFNEKDKEKIFQHGIVQHENSATSVFNNLIINSTIMLIKTSKK